MDRLADFMQGDVVRISPDTLKEMERIALSNQSKKRYRICLHDSPENRQHEMLVCMTRGEYVRPHRHGGMSETHVILKGSERIFLFDEDGDVETSFLLDPEKGDLCYRINADIYHMSVPLSDTVIELEVKGGPFSPESNIFLPSAPDGENQDEVKWYVEELLKKT